HERPMHVSNGKGVATERTGEQSVRRLAERLAQPADLGQPVVTKARRTHGLFAAQQGLFDPHVHQSGLGSLGNGKSVSKLSVPLPTSVLSFRSMMAVLPSNVTSDTVRVEE